MAGVAVRIAKPRAFIFDWNGTLTNMESERRLSVEAFRECFRIYGIKAPTEAEYFTTISANYMEDFYYPYGIPRTVTRDDLNKIRTAFILKRWDASSLLKPSAKSLIRHCSWLTDSVCAIVSGEYKPLLDKGLENSGLLMDFRYVKSDACPKAIWLKYALTKLGAEPCRSIYFDDSVEGMRAACINGMLAFGVEDGYAKRRELSSAGAHVILPLEMYTEFLRRNGM